MGDVIEPAPSGRSKCRGCQRKIDKGELRYGEAVPNAFGAGDALHWYHPRCGAERRSEPFAAALEAHEGDVPERAELAELAAVGVAHPRWCRLARAERAPSGRARCQHCRDLIEKDALRIALERVEDGMTNPAGFVHVRCAGSYAGSTVGRGDRPPPLEQRPEVHLHSRRLGRHRPGAGRAHHREPRRRRRRHRRRRH